jgi:hypothetical protein
VPSDEALSEIAGLVNAEKSVLVELEAGTGYWAALLRKRGVEVQAFDVSPPDISCGNLYFSHTFTEVLTGGVTMLKNGPGGNVGKVLLLVSDSCGHSMRANTRRGKAPRVRGRDPQT